MATQAPSPFSGTLKLATYPNRFNTVVPAEGPFYRTGLKLTSTGTNPRPLTEGLDYYLCYYFKEAAEALQDQIFGGIMLLTETEVNYTIYSVGREYRVPQSEIGKFLVSQDMKDPRNVDWSTLMRYAPVVAPIDPPANLDEAILRDEVVKALDDIRKGIIKRVSDMDDAYAEVTDQIFQNGKKIFDDNMYQHHLIKNAHEYTAEEVGALKVLQKAVDSTKAFGRTIDELVNIMKTNGISQTHIDTLLPVVLGELRGRMRVLDNGALTFRTADSSHVITLQGDKFLITTTKPLNLTADADNNDPGIAVEVTAGYNAMYVASGAVAPIFNGAYLVTPDMVSLYLSAVKLQPANAYFQSTDSVKIYGNGKDYSPVNMSTVVDTADTTKPGLMLISSISANISPGAAISQAAVTALKTTLDKYVDQTYTVNGKGFVITADKQELTLTPTDIGLGNVNNTTPRQKPLTTAIINVLKTKALKTHTHTFADLTGVPTASDTVAGLLQLWDAIDTTTNKVVTSKQGYNVQQRIETLKTTVNQLLPAWTAGGTAFGNPGYLPIPAVGNYAGYQKNIESDARLGVVRKEGSNLYALRNATDGIAGSEYIYYAYAAMSDAGVLTGLQQTSMTYNPAGLAALAPGVRLVKIVIPGDDCMVAYGSDKRYYLVMFNGTLNQAKHTQVYVFNRPDESIDGRTAPLTMDPTTISLTMYKDKLYIVRSLLDNVRYCVAVWSGKPGETYAPVTLTGSTSTNGSYARLKEDLTDRINQRDAFNYWTPEGDAYWTHGRNVVHGPQANRGTVLKESKLRVGFCVSVWLATASGGQGFPRWPTSFTIDLESKSVVIDNPEIFPLKVDVGGITFANGTTITAYAQDVKWPQGAANNRTYVTFSGNDALVYWDISDNTSPGGVATAKLPAGLDAFEFMSGKSKPGSTQVSNWTFNGGRGSLYELSMTAPLYVGDNKYLMSPAQGNRAILVEVDPNTTYDDKYGGCGPTNNRTNFDWATYLKLTGMPYVSSTDVTVGTPNGCWWDAAGTKYYTAIGSAPTADTLNISSTEWNKLVSIVKTAPGSGAENGYANERINGAEKLLISLFAFRPKATNPVFLAQAVAMAVRNGTRYVDYYLFRVTPTVSSTGEVTFPVNSASTVWFDNNQNWSAVDISITDFTGRGQRYGQMLMCEGADKKGILYIPCAYTVNQVGNTVSVNIEMVYDATTSFVSTFAQTRSNYTGYQPNFVTPLKGKLCRTDLSSIGPAFCAGPAATVQEWMTAKWANPPTAKVEIVAGVKTAEGWNFYLTEATTWRIGAHYYTAAAYTVDLKAAFPGNYQNRVFYVHVVLVGQTPQYQLLAAKQPDTDTRLYLGTITTDSSRIVGTDLRKVKRLGGLKQLVEHAGNVYEHDLDVAVDLKQSPLGLLKKEALGQDITKSTYFDSSKLDLMIADQKRANRYPTIKVTPKVFLPGDPMNRATDFYLPPKVAAATSTENSAAAAAGVSWIGTPLKPTADITYAARPLVTPTKSQLLVKLFLPSGASGTTLSMTVNGTAKTVTYGASASVTIPVTAGKRIAVEIGGSVTTTNLTRLGSKWLGFTISDWDGTTETLLASSGVDTPLMYYAQNDSMENMVLVAEAIELGVDASAYMAVAFAGGGRFAPPILVSGTELIVATKWVSPEGLEQATDLAVHLMPKL